MRFWINLIIVVSLMISCSTSRNSLSFENVTKGKQLEYAQEISIDQFFKIWMDNRLSKVDINCHYLYKDSSYVYFGKNKSTFLSLVPNLYKVNSDSLAFRLGDYNKIDAQRIRKEFWDKVVTTSDRNIFENPTENGGTYYRKFDYSLNGKKIMINLEMKIIRNKTLFFVTAGALKFKTKYQTNHTVVL